MTTINVISDVFVVLPEMKGLTFVNSSVTSWGAEDTSNGDVREPGGSVWVAIQGIEDAVRSQLGGSDASM